MSKVVLFEGHHEKLLLDVLIDELGVLSESYLYFHAEEERTNNYTVIEDSQDDYCRSVVSSTSRYSNLFKCENGKDHLDEVISDKLDFFSQRFDEVLFLRDVDSASQQTFRSDFKQIVDNIISDFKSNNIQNSDVSRTKIKERGRFSVTSIQFSTNEIRMVGLYKDLEHLTGIEYGQSKESKKEKIRNFVKEEENFFREVF